MRPRLWCCDGWIELVSLVELVSERYHGDVGSIE